MWEIMDRGKDYVLWMRKDAEGRLEWLATSDNCEPTQQGLASAKLAINRLKEDMEMDITLSSDEPITDFGHE